MGVFVCIESEVGTCHRNFYQLRAGPLRGAAADVGLWDLSINCEIARLSGYPVGTEPGLCLFAKLLERCGPEVLAAAPPHSLQVSLACGCSISKSREEECLTLILHDCVLQVTWTFLGRPMKQFSLTPITSDTVRSTISAGASAITNWPECTTSVTEQFWTR
jgi:hypothetical protein